MHSRSWVVSRIALVLSIAALGVTAIGATPQSQRAMSTPAILTTAPQSPEATTKAQTLAINGKEFQEGLSLTIHDPAGGTVVIRDKAILARDSTSFTVSATFPTSGAYSLVVSNPDGG